MGPPFLHSQMLLTAVKAHRVAHRVALEGRKWQKSIIRETVIWGVRISGIEGICFSFPA